MTKWPTDVTVKFVSEYVLHEILWNVNHPLHKNSTAKARAYRSIKHVMNLPNFDEKEVQRKIRSIRSTYCQEKRKIMDAMKTRPEDYLDVSSLKWFPILDSVLKDRITIHWEESNGNSSIGELNYYQLLESKFSPDHNASDSDELLRSPLECARQDKMDDSDLQPTNYAGIMEMTTTKEENEFDIFGKSVAAQLKTLPLEKALQAQKYIQNYITDVRLQQLDAT